MKFLSTDNYRSKNAFYKQKRPGNEFVAGAPIKGETANR